jgi:hypothetical protein
VKRNYCDMNRMRYGIQTHSELRPRQCHCPLPGLSRALGRTKKLVLGKAWGFFPQVPGSHSGLDSIAATIGMR